MTYQADRKSGPSKPMTIAYLGPSGTYGHKAATLFQQGQLKQLHSDAERFKLIPCATLSDVYNSSAHFFVLPIENTIHGAVLETLDSIINPPSPAPRIISNTNLSISHSLVALRGTSLDAIEYVQSHEQALGQCSRWIERNLRKGVERRQTSSTAGAAAALLERGAGCGAAVCSKDVVDQCEDLEVLAEGIQDRKINATRFLLFEQGTYSSGATLSRKPPGNSIAFVCSSTPHPSALSHPRIAVLSVHSRPAPIDHASGDIFPRRYLIEVLVSDEVALEALGKDDDVVMLGGWAL